jgi:hypothetical protein
MTIHQVHSAASQVNLRSLPVGSANNRHCAAEHD